MNFNGFFLILSMSAFLVFILFRTSSLFACTIHGILKIRQLNTDQEMILSVRKFSCIYFYIRGYIRHQFSIGYIVYNEFFPICYSFDSLLENIFRYSEASNNDFRIFFNLKLTFLTFSMIRKSLARTDDDHMRQQHLETFYELTNRYSA